MELSNMLCFQLAKAHQIFNRFYQQPLKRYHLTYVQYVVLVALWNGDRITVNQLSQQVGLNNGTLTPLLKRLQRNGWVTRTRDPKDERRVIITLTKCPT
ncbi:MAG: MarR family transcriptional regulator [Acetilactobacillus jinshanensis]